MLANQIQAALFSQEQRAAAFRKRRDFQAAIIDRLTSDWTTSTAAPAESINKALLTVRKRSRERYFNDGYARRYVKLMHRGIFGPNGIVLQARARDPGGTLDTAANGLIEAGWTDWGKRANCTVTRRMSWLDVGRLYTKSLVVDGEVIIRGRSGWKHNPHRFALQFIDPDLLDVNFNEPSGVPESNGREIRAGVEWDDDHAAVAYWFLTSHPAQPRQRNGRRYVRVTADEILHDFIPEVINQERGVPWLIPSLWRMHMLDGYEDSAVVGARIGAAKMGFFTRTAETQGFGGDDEDAADSTLSMSAEPGLLEELPAGVDFKSWDPSHPNLAHAEFVKSELRGIAAGGDVSYFRLANDLEGVNFSSARIGNLDDQDAMQDLQNFVKAGLCDWVFERWLKSSLLAGAITLPAGKIDKFSAHEWQARVWKGTDPVKEATAYQTMLQNRLVSRGQIIRETQNRDPAEVWEELQQEEELLKSMGLDPNTEARGTSGP